MKSVKDVEKAYEDLQGSQWPLTSLDSALLVIRCKEDCLG